MNLISNGIEFKIPTKQATLYYGELNHPIANKRSKELFKTKIEEVAKGDQLIFENNDEKDFYFSFEKLSDDFEKEIIVSFQENYLLARLFVKDRLRMALNPYFIIRPYGYGFDLNILKSNNQFPFQDWESFTTYNISIHTSKLYLARASSNSLISTKSANELNLHADHITHVLQDDLLLHKELVPNYKQCRALATRETRLSQGLTLSRKELSFREYFNSISSFLEELYGCEINDISILQSRFGELKENVQYFRLARSFNIMEFNNGHTNVNASNGMKFAGPKFVPNEIADKLEFIYISKQSKGE